MEAEDHASMLIRRQRVEIDKLKRQVCKMTQALLLIQAWRMPFDGYIAEYGSNGERDYVRQVASDALKTE